MSDATAVHGLWSLVIINLLVFIISADLSVFWPANFALPW